MAEVVTNTRYHEFSFHTLSKVAHAGSLNTPGPCFQGGHQVLGIMCLNKLSFIV